jgi:hypothetical protein
MILFLLIWVVVVAAAGGLAVGALWGRAPQKGSCAGREGADCSLAARRGCGPDDPVRHNPSSASS